MLERRWRVEPIWDGLEIVEVAIRLEGGDQHPIEGKRGEYDQSDHRGIKRTLPNYFSGKPRHVKSPAAAATATAGSPRPRGRGTGTDKWPLRERHRPRACPPETLACRSPACCESVRPSS